VFVISMVPVTVPVVLSSQCTLFRFHDFFCFLFGELIHEVEAMPTVGMCV